MYLQDHQSLSVEPSQNLNTKEKGCFQHGTCELAEV